MTKAQFQEEKAELQLAINKLEAASSKKQDCERDRQDQEA